VQEVERFKPLTRHKNMTNAALLLRLIYNICKFNDFVFYWLLLNYI